MLRGLAGVLAGCLTVLPSLAAGLLIEDVTVLDGTGAPAVRHASVRISGERISQISTSRLAPRAGEQRLDGRGRFLIPGLMDVHIHLVGTGEWRGLANAPGVALDFAAGEAALRGYLYFGVTSVYDAGNVPQFIFDLRRRERAGEIPSPRIFATGAAISYPGSWMAGDWHGVGAPEWPQTTRLLDQQIAQHPDLQKLVMERGGIGPNPLTPYLSGELAAHIIGYLKAHGVRTTVHATVEDLARAAVDGGIDTLAHPVGLARETPEFTRVLAQRRIPVATTLAVTDEILRLSDAPEYLDDPMFRAVLRPEEIAARKAQGRKRYASLGWTALFRLTMPYAMENLRRIHEAGGVLALGTDRSEGPLVHHELELLARAGIPVPDLLRIATYNGALFLGREQDLGSIATGKLADLVLLEADPTLDVANYRRIAAVIKGGVAVDRSRLDLPVNER